jgi:hypothetical protein
MQLSRQERNGVQWKLGNRSIWSFYFPEDEWEIYAEIALTRSPVVPPPPPPPSCLVPSPSALLQLLRRTATHLEANRPAVPAPARAASAWRLATIAPLLSRNGRRRNNGRRWGTDAGALSGGRAAPPVGALEPPDRNLTVRNGAGRSGFATLPRLAAFFGATLLFIV